LKNSGILIKRRLRELVDEYDEHVRECSTVIDGLSLATSTVSTPPPTWTDPYPAQEVRHLNERLAFSALVVSRLTQRDGNLMKSIALLTVIYLPVTFASVRSKSILFSPFKFGIN
jgi:hypothetical protein